MSQIASFAIAFAFNGFAVGSNLGDTVMGDSAVSLCTVGDSTVATATVSDAEAAS